MRRRRRENQILKGLIRAAVAVAICIAGLILFFVFIWWQAQQAERTTDEEAAALMRQQAEPLVIETPEPATEGSITIYTPDGAVYGYFGNIDIISDGRDGSQINIVLTGWLVGETHEEAESEAGNE